MAYGVIPSGFELKRLPEILAEIEAANVTIFGPGVVQTAASPLGQLNGLVSDLVATLWEVAEDVYQAYDVDQAEGARLDAMAKLRLLRRGLAEGDIAFRSAITNQGQARVDIPDIEREITSIAGVSYVKTFVNDSEGVDANLIPPGTICVAVLGGNDQEIADAMRRFVVPGISTYGNTSVSAQDEDGFCRSMLILRPILIPVTLTINIRVARDNFGCPPPSPIAVRDAFLADMASGPKRLINGDDLDYFRVRSAIESRFQNIEVVSFSGQRDNIGGVQNQTVVIGFIEMATLSADGVTVNAI